MDFESTDSSYLQLIWNAAEPIARAFLAVLKSPLQQTHRLYWLFLLSSLMFALIVYLRSRDRGQPLPKSPSGFLRSFVEFCFPASVWKNPSAWLDVRYFFVSQTVLTIFQPILTFGALGAITTKVCAGWATALFDTPPLSSEPSATLSVIYSLAIVMILDFGAYWGCRS